MSEESLIEDIKRDIEELLTAKRAVKIESSLNSSDYNLEIQNTIEGLFRDVKEKESQLQLNSASIPITSHRRFLGPLFNFYKRIVRISTDWLYQPLFNRISNFNSGLINILKKILADRLKINRELVATKKHTQFVLYELANLQNKTVVNNDKIQKELTALQNRLITEKEEIQSQLTVAGDYNRTIRQELTQIHKLVENYRSEAAFLQTKLSLALEYFEKNSKEGSENLTRAARQEVEKLLSKALSDSFYFNFERKFRGSEEEIKQRQGIYLPYVKRAFDECGGFVLDLGTGRGEFLELCREANIQAKGIDMNEAMFEHCCQKGLNVQKAEIFTYLRGLSNENLCAITAFQLVEHLSYKELLNLLQLSLIKLKPGGIVILETQNPNNFNSLRHFYIDLSHQRPIPSETLSFILEAIGFKKVELLFTSPVPEKFHLKGNDENIPILNNLLWGNQDYAVIGCRE